MFCIKRSLLLIITMTLTLSFSSFAGTQTQAQTLTVMTHDSFNISKKVITRFEQENQVTVRFLKAGDAGRHWCRPFSPEKIPWLTFSSGWTTVL